MWLIDKGSEGRCGSRIPLPPLLENSLIHWYTGAGGSAEEQAGITLVQQARLGEKWLACDCLGAVAAPPILTPAYLSDAETYYLRRLTGQKRPEHRTTCPFFRDQATSRVSEVRERQLPAETPLGYFEIIRPAPEKLAQMPERDAVDDRTRHASFPRLALLLRRLLEVGGLTEWTPGTFDDANAVGRQFARLRSVAARIEAAPGIALDRVLWTHSAALHSRQIYAALRALEPQWPSAHAPQGFLLVYAREFHGHVVHPASGEPYRVANRVQSPAVRGTAVDGPFLVLTVIGTYPEARGYAPLRAYAQPILSGRSFIAVESNAERDLFKQLIAFFRDSIGRGYDARLHKPLFDQFTALGTCRADAVAEILSLTTGEVSRLALLLHEQGGPFPAASLGALRTQMPTILVDPDKLDRANLLSALEGALGSLPI
ncbi:MULTISPECIES: hypothetical protein [unclassified Sphingomonas]|uniref:hypothetical protein n=1 Tax=unclassified Sphingomonas TaxID=196159 RepID=UPI000A9D34C5|nr:MULTISPECIES: hypothetical protein [unclassified Sphingomonas]MBN8850120.1 hypothetical protein [Sphingomonas sp.]